MLKSIYRFSFLFFVACSVLFTACSRKASAPSSNSANKTPKFENTPVWADEFNVNGKPDASKWSYDVGGGGWGNNELEYYTEGDNATVKDGKLLIEVRKEARGDKNYTSARMVSKNKGDFLYGRFEARAKIPNGRGLWPAIWMLPTDWTYGGWPQSGEIDILEQVGSDPDRLHISVHTEAYNHVKGTQKTATTVIPNATADFHVYRMDWTPEEIKGFIDDKLIFSFANEHKTSSEWPFDKRFHWLLNVAVGGNWGGQKGVDDSAFPTAMEVDYVRAYKLVE